MKKNKGGQVWIETVLYTLIGLALIGLALGFIMPKINEARDKAIVEQAINSLSEFDGKINEVIETGTGNVRQIEIYMKKGELEINSGDYVPGGKSEMKITLSELSKPYSEPNVTISFGRVQVMTEEGQKTSSVSLKVSYSYNITFNGLNQNKKFTPASTPYKFSIKNNGAWINIEEISGQS